MKNAIIGILLTIVLIFIFLFGYKEYKRQQFAKQITNLRNNSIQTESKGAAPADFEIISIRGKWEGGRLRAIGEIKNNGKIAAGPKIEVIARDANGALVESQSFWPASVSNIPPGGTNGIGFTITRDRSAKSIEAKVVSVDVW